MQKLFKKHLPLVLFHVVFFALVLVNFPFDKTLLGWDSLNPEFNFLLNVKRAFTAFWQENYGLGTLGGHGFAATLPHTLVTLLLAFFLPNDMIRATFTFLCLYLGGLGMYVLLDSMLKKIRISNIEYRNKSELSNNKRSKFFLSFMDFDIVSNFELRTSYLALFGSFFYMLNLGTVQIFSVQLETFIAHYAALPWLFWSVIRLLHDRSKKNLFLFIVITFFASLQGFIPSLFVAYVIALVIFLGIFLLLTRTKDTLTSVFLILLLTFFVNAYWLFPLMYYQTTRNVDFLNAYNNSISTPHFIDINKKYGDIQNVPLLKGYLFDAYQLGGFILEPWIAHHNNFLVTLVGYSFFLLVLLGIGFAFMRIRHFAPRALIGVFFFFFVSLATNFPPFSYITKLLHLLSPTFEQAFRTTFTKFSIGVAFSYSIFITLGLLASIILIQRKRHAKKRIVPLLAISISVLLLYALPAFQGNLLYNKMKVTMPAAYRDVMDYFAQAEDGRIADFPQDCPEGWYAYNWGYFGSGFYWYGVKQPFLSRSFDVWSRHNENYYWEISQAMREENYEKVDAVLQKYHVRWVLYDPNVLYCRNQKAFITHEAWVKYLDQSPKYKLIKTFTSEVLSPIKLYQNKGEDTQSFVTLKTDLPNIGPQYTSIDNDWAYTIHGDYAYQEEQPFDAYYPFRALFTKRHDQEHDVTIEETPDALIFNTPLPAQERASTILLPEIATTMAAIPVRLSLIESGPNLEVYASFLLPKIALDETELLNTTQPVKIGQFRLQPNTPLTVAVNGKEITPTANGYDTVFSPNAQNTLAIQNASGTNVFSWQSTQDALLTTLLNQHQSVTIPPHREGNLRVETTKVVDGQLYGIEQTNTVDTTIPYSCNEQTPSDTNRHEISGSADTRYLRLISQNSTQCVAFYFPNLITSFGYIVDVKTRHISGNYPRLTVYNKDRVVYNDVYIESPKTLASQYIILPPTFPNEIGYDIQIANASESSLQTINDISGINIWYIPYPYIQSLSVTSPAASVPVAQPVEGTHLAVTHPNETYYQTTFTAPQSPSDTTLILSQGYDMGWKAYQIQNSKFKIQNYFVQMFPFIFGTELKEHVRVNSWANGWTLDEAGKQAITIVYMPQYGQYGGYLLLFLSFIIPFFVQKKPEPELPHQSPPA